jgi:hypothetical protein
MCHGFDQFNAIAHQAMVILWVLVPVHYELHPEGEREQAMVFLAVVH